MRVKELIEITKNEDRALGKRYFYDARAGKVIEIDEEAIKRKTFDWFKVLRAQSAGRDLGIKEGRSWWRRWFG